jgi:hypothetical protein
MKKSLNKWLVRFLETHPVAKDLFLYYIKGVEDGPRIEKRMLKLQGKFERWCKKNGVALIAFKGANDQISLSFVPEQKWDKDRAMYEAQMIEEAAKQPANAFEPK